MCHNFLQGREVKLPCSYLSTFESETSYRSLLALPSEHLLKLGSPNAFYSSCDGRRMGGSKRSVIEMLQHLQRKSNLCLTGPGMVLVDDVINFQNHKTLRGVHDK